MKWIVAILIAAALALGVWLSLTVGRIEPGTKDTDMRGGGSAARVDYQDPGGVYSISYPAGYRAEQYVYQALPERSIPGTRFSIPASLSAGTNLSPDSYVSVEVMPGAINSCSAQIYLASPVHEGFVDVGEHRYSVASSMEAAAGNRYEERVYATPIDGGCIGVRYFIHYGAIENYPKGAVTNFDRQALSAQFDTIRQSLVLR